MVACGLFSFRSPHAYAWRLWNDVQALVEKWVADSGPPKNESPPLAVALLVTQSHHRVDPCRAAGGKVAGGETGHCDHRDHTAESDRIDARDAE